MKCMVSSTAIPKQIQDEIAMVKSISCPMRTKNPLVKAIGRMFGRRDMRPILKSLKRTKKIKQINVTEVAKETINILMTFPTII